MIHVKEFRKIKEKLNNILLKHTGHPFEKIQQDTERDNFMSAEDARQFGPMRRRERRRIEGERSPNVEPCESSHFGNGFEHPFAESLATGEHPEGSSGRDEKNRWKRHGTNQGARRAVHTF